MIELSKIDPDYKKCITEIIDYLISKEISVANLKTNVEPTVTTKKLFSIINNHFIDKDIIETYNMLCKKTKTTW